MIIPFASNGRAPTDRYLVPSPKDDLPLQFVTLGAYSYVGSSNIENHTEPVHIAIGRFSSLAGGITFSLGLNHHYKKSVTTYPFDDLVKEFIGYGKTYHHELIPSRKYDNNHQIIIGNDVWIGNGATILGGVKIGSGAIIGTRSVVAKDIPPYAIAVGNPAQVVKYRFDEETRKKFMAVKWWNWDIDKICANVHKMYDVEKFLAEHYSSALENIPDDILSKEIESYRAEGRDVYTFIADFRANYPLWRRVLSGMLKSTKQNAAMIFFIGTGASDKDLEELKNFPQTVGQIKNMPIIKCILPTNGQIFSPQALRKSTHFITNREMITLECLDWLYNTDVKILSALDEGIFEGV